MVRNLKRTLLGLAAGAALVGGLTHVTVHHRAGSARLDAQASAARANSLSRGVQRTNDWNQIAIRYSKRETLNYNPGLMNTIVGIAGGQKRSLHRVLWTLRQNLRETSTWSLDNRIDYLGDANKKHEAKLTAEKSKIKRARIMERIKYNDAEIDRLSAIEEIVTGTRAVFETLPAGQQENFYRFLRSIPKPRELN